MNKMDQFKNNQIPILKKSILEQIEDLKAKIESGEPCPDRRSQDYELLTEIDSGLDEIMNNWYY